PSGSAPTASVTIKPSSDPTSTTPPSTTTATTLNFTGTMSPTGVVTSGSNQITSVSDTTHLVAPYQTSNGTWVRTFVSGSGIATTTDGQGLLPYVTNVSGTAPNATVTISQNATGGSGPTITFNTGTMVADCYAASSAQTFYVDQIDTSHLAKGMTLKYI